MAGETLLTFFLLGDISGLYGGYHLGRAWAEDSRARKGMDKMWNERQEYRKK